MAIVAGTTKIARSRATTRPNAVHNNQNLDARPESLMTFSKKSSQDRLGVDSLDGTVMVACRPER